MKNLDDNSFLRPSPSYPLYPGNYVNPEEYLEQYFYNYYCSLPDSQKSSFKRKYIPVWWTNLFLNNSNNPYLGFVQDYLKSLDQKDSYFTIVQMDDGISYNLPEDTLVFHAGGNTGNGNKIPIPLVSSSIPTTYIRDNVKKEYLASFVGSSTHPIRNLGRMWLYDEPDFYFNKETTWKNHVVEDEFKEFCDIAQKSWFNLCFAGYGDSSFRLYQSLELGTIPVYISDRPFWLPKHYLMEESQIDWEDFCLTVHSDKITEIPSLLNKISIDERKKMIKLGAEVYKKFFNLRSLSENVCQQI